MHWGRLKRTSQSLWLCFSLDQLPFGLHSRLSHLKTVFFLSLPSSVYHAFLPPSPAATVTFSFQIRLDTARAKKREEELDREGMEGRGCYIKEEEAAER